MDVHELEAEAKILKRMITKKLFILNDPSKNSFFIHGN